ncbi:DUF721 domain-containing protein [Sphingomonas sp.]|uniref:DUF721 domain-containing protein n=1 Tax=Sphingomonas sp. TaxID=28214 RepID=UPI0025E0EB0D|nr:DUF721 domain-containing protein [Sphingomonas sp.]
MSKVPRPPKPPTDAPRGGPARTVSELLPDIGGAAFRKFGFVQSSVVTRWAEIVGPRFAAVSAPESIRFPRGRREEGTLHLVVRGAHGPVLQHIVPEIIERVNRFFGYPAVARVAMRSGAVAGAAPATQAAPPAPKPVPAELGDSLRAVVDPELRAVLAALAAGVATTSGPPRIGERAE